MVVGAEFACIPLCFSGAGRDQIDLQLTARGWKAAPTIYLRHI